MVEHILEPKSGDDPYLACRNLMKVLQNMFIHSSFKGNFAQGLCLKVYATF